MAVLDRQENIKYCKTNSRMAQILSRIGELHDRKSHDYAHGGNPYSNFEEAAVTAGTSVDSVFRTMLGIKLARLNALSRTQDEPNFESIQDTILDLATYSCIYAAWFAENEVKKMMASTKKSEETDAL